MGPLQVEVDILPKLIVFGEEPQYFQSGSVTEGEAQVWLAQTVPFFKRLETILDGIQAFAENLLVQLGSLCAGHTRKATILQGETLPLWGVLAI